MRRANFCEHCRQPKAKKNKRFCSLECYGKSLRGTGKSHVRIRILGERVYLHRWIFETKVRPLREGEIIHHRNDNKHDNRLENLEPLPNQAEHLKAHDYYRSLRKSEEEFADFGW